MARHTATQTSSETIKARILLEIRKAKPNVGASPSSVAFAERMLARQQDRNVEIDLEIGSDEHGGRISGRAVAAADLGLCGESVKAYIVTGGERFALVHGVPAWTKFGSEQALIERLSK
jgi:hypothetical protein